MPRRTLRTLLVLFLLPALLLAGCSDRPTLRPLSQGAVILAFGDSLTHGTGAPPADAYPNLLAGMLGRTVINAGLPGEVSSAGLKRLPRLLDQYHPALVILCHGGNDFLRRGDKATLERNLRAMVALCRTAGADVVLLGVPDLGLLLATDPLYERVADDLNLPYDGEIIADLLGERSLKSDRIHPNAQGYRRLAEAVAKLVREAGALP